MSNFPAPCLADEELAQYVEGDPHPDLRERVELHVDHCDDCRRLVSALVHEESALDAAGPEERSGGTMAPSIGRYRVLGPLGMGARGVVVSAYDPELDRPVAIKLLRANLLQGDSAREARERLLREARAMARVAHPNVVAVYDVGTHGEQVFVAMELVEGHTLRTELSARAHPPRHILQLFTQAGEGLWAAHRAGLVHRDFKPDNVLVGTDGRVRVTDFGLASVRNEVGPALDDRDAPSWSLDASLTLSGVALGTPRYMAPEQHLGTSVDARADQFAFCVALYEALTGEHPFPCGSYEELRAAVLGGVPRERLHVRDVPSSVRNGLLRGLSARPEARHGSMAELLASLGAERPVRRFASPLLWALVLVASLTVWLSRRHRQSPAPRPAAVSVPSSAEPVPAFTRVQKERAPASPSEVPPATAVPPMLPVRSAAPTVPRRRVPRASAPASQPPEVPQTGAADQAPPEVPRPAEPPVRFAGPRLKPDEF